DRVRLDVIEQLKSAEIQEQSEELYTRIDNYLKTIPQTTLLSENLQYDLADLLNNDDADPEIQLTALEQLDISTSRQILNQRQDGYISPQDIEQIVHQIFLGRQRALSNLEERLASEKSTVQGLQARIESYLRNTDKAELNPEGIKRDLQTLRQDPQLGLISLRYRFSQFDRDTFVKLLTERRDLSEQQVNQTIDQIESNWENLTRAPQALANKAKEQYDEFSTSLADYLRNTRLEELNPEGIQRDLSKLLNNPKAGTLALRRRLSQVDRETLVKLLSQREDLSEAQINQALNQVQSAIRQVVKAPRRFASRTQAQIKDFQSNLENYLRNTDKEELNPQSIKRDLQLLLQDPGIGLENLNERLAKFDRSTIVALLAQRPDISEEEANRIIDEIESVRNQFIEQVRNIERRIQSAIDSVFGRIRKYLNSLERPELNYDGIRLDIRKLFADPQAGFDALRDRLAHFNRDTLVAILSSRDDISEADANRIIDQIEGARSSVIQRAERLQHAAQKQLSEIKHQAKISAEETRKAAEIASWWVFGTAITSAIVSAIAGAIAVNPL
ncbi:MAG: MFS transporter, partial [Calothrix sp. SM1_7_51]|nr:MFS transporter [Calothrix sp. SM1_7_51]